LIPFGLRARIQSLGDKPSKKAPGWDRAPLQSLTGSAVFVFVVVEPSCRHRRNPAAIQRTAQMAA
jgi:hypothetical protein